MTGRVTVFLEANPEGRARLLELLRADAEGSPAEPGNVCFRVGQDILDPDRFVICENWESREALHEHFKHEYARAAKSAFDDPQLIAGFDTWFAGEDA
ncbi:MAG: antibiotic biosynthesis monooxygenase [Chloroflexi bacterium]|nr:antibiotic biosynthesis monooxygenase [Chloroflexota bacterium]